MTQKKRLYMILTGLAVVIAAFVAVALWPTDKTFQLDRPESQLVYLIDKKPNQISQVAIIDGAAAEGTMPFIISRTDSPDITFAAMGGENLDPDKLYAFVANISTVFGEANLGSATPEKLTEFGLNPPAKKITITYADNTSDTVTLGGKLPLGDGYYLQKQGDENVYIIGTFTGGNMLRNIQDMRQNVLFRAYESPGKTFKSILIKHPNGEQLEVVEVIEPSSPDKKPEVSAFEVRQPFIAPAEDGEVGKQLIVPISSLVPEGVFAKTPENVAMYGLENPITVSVKDYYGEQIILLVGSVINDQTFFMLEGDDAIFYAHSGYFEFLNVGAMDVVSKIIWLNNIKTTKSLTVRYDGQEHVIVFDPYTLNGKEITQSNAQFIFLRAHQIFAKGAIGDIPVPQTPEIVLTVTPKNGPVKTLEFFKLNDRQYAAKVDGQGMFYAGIDEIDYLKTGIAQVLDGQDIFY